MSSAHWRFWGLEVLAVGLPVAAVLAVPDPFGYPVVAALVAALLLPLRHWWPRVSVLLCLPALAGGLGWAGTLVTMFRLGRVRPHPRELVGWVLLTCVVAVSPVLITQSLPAGSILLTLGFVLLSAGAPAALGMLVALREQLAASLQRLVAAGEVAAQAKAEVARAEERARIAREIHDAVGHHVTLIAVETAALGATTDDPEVRGAATRVRGLAKQALAEMRSTLGLGESGAAGAARTISDLVEQARGSGVDVELTGDLDQHAVPGAVERAAYRVVQEALTNASKHAPGAVIRVGLHTGSDAVQIVVTNDAPGSDHEPIADLAGGAGLEGLSERVRMAGGELDAGPSEDGGFRLVAVLPQKP
ncbi:sensor histidine kinase [Saccharopolyspora rhizosphaerae]|uniref:histidine kinase n=1 Tax=Saccharopolyspora rhizosphaerae TaxID=2492662 RepID=A0A426K004_9PSEU|nr:sensor histidine kinase [Saccharopolyspora rhizosphaerae]RRO18764.1 sensor histidine kinase [Saccharopolyspora rhizosphaerae]